MMQVFTERWFRINYRVKCNNKTASINEKQALRYVQQKIDVLQKAVLQCKCFGAQRILDPCNIKDTALCDISQRFSTVN